MKLLLALTFDAPNPEAATDILTAIDPPHLPHFAGDVRLTVQPWAEQVERYLDSEDGLPAIADVVDELFRQNQKWGVQDHADGTGFAQAVLRPMDAHTQGFGMQSSAALLADAARTACQANGTPESPDTWAAILLEEVFEALAEEPGSAELRAELIQVAAVAVQWVLAMDRAEAKAGTA